MMQALALKPHQKDSLELIDVPEPEIGPAEILVSTISVGIDATDIEINKGLYGEAPEGESILIPGHEAVGKVVAVGREDGGFEVADIVVPTVRRSCSNCPVCGRNQPDMCQSDDYQERGIKQAHGFFSEFFKESPENLIKIPPEMAPVGALIEPMSIAEKAVEQALKIQESLNRQAENLLVLGAGTLGLLATLTLTTKGYHTYTYDLADADSPKARIAKRGGAEYVEAGRLELADFPKTFGPPDLIIEATGSSAVALSGVNILNKAGIMCLLSVTSGKHTQEFCLDCFNNHLVLGNRIVFGSVSSNRHHFDLAVSTAQSAQTTWPGILDSLITQRLDLAHYKDGFYPKDGSHIKSVVDFHPV